MLLLLGVALVLRRVLPHVRRLPLGVKVLVDGAVMDGLQVLGVFHRKAALLIHGAHLLETHRSMNDLADGIGIPGDLA